MKLINEYFRLHSINKEGKMHKCENVKKHPRCFFFATPKVEKSNFYKDLETLIDIDFKKIDTKNKTT